MCVPVCMCVLKKMLGQHEGVIDANSIIFPHDLLLRNNNRNSKISK